MKGWQLAELYLKALAQSGRSPVTVDSTQRWLARFAAFCEEGFGVTEVTAVIEEHAASFERRLYWEPGFHGQLYAQNSVHHALLMLRLFFRWAVRERHLLLDPFADIVLRRISQVQRRFLTVPEVARLLAAPSDQTALGLRDRALLETFYGAGLRRRECHHLNLGDLDFERQALRILNSKGGARYQPMGPHLRATLERYLEQSRPQLARHPEENALFLGVKGRRLHLVCLANVVREAGAQAGLGQIHPHMLRHAFASHLLQNQADLLEVQALLGHVRLSSTSIYTHVIPAQAAREYRRTHPRARRKKGPGPR